MKNKKFKYILFGVLAILTLYIPYNMIFQNEKIIERGKAYKLKIIPVDPYDPFRGKYVVLNFEDNEVVVPNPEKYKNTEVYVTLVNDENGFAKIDEISKSPPIHNECYFKAKTSYYLSDGKVQVEFPFNRFYMEENKAPEAEKLFNTRDSLKTPYALISIYKGESVIQNVFIDGIPLQEIVEE